MPIERMRVGISSVRASQTQTPGPVANDAKKRVMQATISVPTPGLGIGPYLARLMMSALSGGPFENLVRVGWASLV